MLISPRGACGLSIWGQGGHRARLRSNPDPPQDAESCYLIRALLKFYLNTVFKNYLDEAADVRIRRSFSTLANNFFVIASKLQPSVSRTMLLPGSPREAVCFGETPSPSPYPVLVFIP